MGTPLDEPLPLKSGWNFSKPQLSPRPQSSLAQPYPLSSNPAKTAGRSQDSLPAPIPLVDLKPKHILDFDLETYAAGFADPAWVPQKITCCAWSWFGDDAIESRIATPSGIFGNPSARRDMLADLLEQIRKADMLVGQNIERFDLPVINAECMRLGLDPIRSALVQDTKRLPKSLGFKKGQDNMCELFGTEEKKLSLNWQQWNDAYDEDGWKTVRDRCESDVRANKQLWVKLLSAGYLRPARQWVGFR